MKYTIRKGVNARHWWATRQTFNLNDAIGLVGQSEPYAPSIAFSDQGIETDFEKVEIFEIVDTASGEAVLSYEPDIDWWTETETGQHVEDTSAWLARREDKTPENHEGDDECEGPVLWTGDEVRAMAERVGNMSLLDEAERLKLARWMQRLADVAELNAIEQDDKEENDPFPIDEDGTVNVGGLGITFRVGSEDGDEDRPPTPGERIMAENLRRAMLFRIEAREKGIPECPKCMTIGYASSKDCPECAFRRSLEEPECPACGEWGYETSEECVACNEPDWGATSRSGEGR